MKGIDPGQSTMAGTTGREMKIEFAPELEAQNLTDLYHEKVISLETAVQAASNPSDFQRALHFE